jgi:hypothetical protein
MFTRTKFLQQRRNSMRILICLIFLTACAVESATGPAENSPDPSIVKIGNLQNRTIDEASGLAQSNVREDRLWTLNDSGSAPVIYAFAEDGSNLGAVRLRGARNVDWEDLASFEFDGRSWLLVADVGDNLGRRESVTLYIVEEPHALTDEVIPERQIRFVYPDGPKDVEAVAVDAENQLAYVLSKRTIPPGLYSVPLRPGSDSVDDVVTATYLGTVESIPRPTQEDLDRALAEKSWHWQPTAMDFSADGSKAIILTYRALYLYGRQSDESWYDALQRTPATFALGNIKEAEASSFGDAGIFLTVEARNAALYRIDIAR